MGNRFKGSILPGAMPWKNRYIGNPFLSLIGRIIFRTKIGDFHCGIRGLTKEAFNKMKLKSTGMEFASEMIIKAALFNLKIAEVPTTLKKDGRTRPPHLKPFRDGWRHLRLIFLFSPRWLFLYPGICAVVFGTAICLRIFINTWSIGPFNLDLNSMLYAGALILVGVQSVFFAVFSKIFSVQTKLLPPDPKLNQLFKFIKLETGLILGGLLFIIGALGFFKVFAIWSGTNYGLLNPNEILRIRAYASNFLISHH
jgi:hypothetical protein